MFAKRTDLAMEARELWQESAGKTTRLPGVRAAERRLEGYPLTWVEILDERGASALEKPVGCYAALDLSAFWQRRPDFFERAVRAVGRQIRELVPDSGAVLVVGLGNAAMTPDAVGPLAADSVLVTRHLIAAHAPAVFRLPAGIRGAHRGTGHHRGGIRRGGAGRGGAGAPQCRHRGGCAGLPPDGAGVHRGAAQQTPELFPVPVWVTAAQR